MYHSTIIVAYFLDPKYRGEYLVNQHAQINFILAEASKLVDSNLGDTLAGEILQYKSMEEVFNSEFLWFSKATKNSFVWWKGLINDAPVLVSLAMKLMHISASSAAA